MHFLKTRISVSALVETNLFNSYMAVIILMSCFASRSFVKHISADTESDVVKVTATTVI